VQNYEPCAVFPHPEVQYNIALCIKELQDEEQKERLLALQKEFKYGPCIGIQLDMWTNPHTHVAYGGVNAVTVREPLIFTSGSTGSAKKPPPQLKAVSEVLDFDVFPLTQHTGEAISEWLQAILIKKGIVISSISGSTPDGAADGQKGMRMIVGLGDKTDTCNLHGLQSSVMHSTGLRGSPCKNLEFKLDLKAHNRIAQLKNQSRQVSDGIRNAQLAVDIPLTKVLTTVDTSSTRWGNEFEQVQRDCVLRLIIDQVVDAYKREHRNKKDAIVEDDEEDPTSRVGKAVPATALGLSGDAWDRSLEIEAFLDHPYTIKDSIEHKGYVTGAISLFLLHNLKKGCASDKPLQVKLFPSTAKLVDRERQSEMRQSSDLYELISTARKIMENELALRFFSERPSNTRLVQIWMCKQYPAEKWLPPEWHTLAKGLYLTMLREAAKISGTGLRSSPPRKKKKSAAGGSSLLRNLSDDDEEVAGTSDFDTVTDEAERWSKLDKKIVSEFKDDDGIVNEFALLYECRD
jgi:hypothetical protein